MTTTHICVPSWQRTVSAGEPAGSERLPRGLVPWAETGQVPLPWLGFAPAGWDPHPWLRSPPADGVRAVAGVPAHSWGMCGWPSVVPSPPSSCGPARWCRGTPWWATEALGFAVKPRWISSEFGTFKFSNSYVSRAGRTSGLWRST